MTNKLVEAYQHLSEPIKMLVSIITVFGTIGGSVLFVEAHYAHADEVTQLEEKVQKVDEKAKNGAEAGKAILDVVILEKEMKIMMLEVKKESSPNKKLTPAEEVELRKSKEILEKVKETQKQLVQH